MGGLANSGSGPDLHPRRAKLYALALLAFAAFLFPMLERALTGRVELLSGFGVAETLVGLAAIYWWYHVDKAERQYRAGPLMNGGMVALTIVAMPIYFVRSRGWKHGLTATAVAIAVYAVTLGLETLGERLGSALYMS
jgi:hypothetical protein